MGKKLIFVADDQPNVRKLISHWVKGDEYDVREFDRGSDLLEALEEKPDAVCLDIVMPGMDGFEVLNEIQVKAPGLPVIMVTATDSLEIAVEAIRKGAYDFITKPIDRHRLIASLKKAVEKNSMVKEINQLRKALGHVFSF
ncbi:MAG: response regulator, partial [Desulfobacula sp.]|nr:response regulator [Desulfobacula sp.]